MKTLEELTAITDPAERARACTHVLDHDSRAYLAAVARLRQHAVGELKKPGVSYSDIAALLGLHRSTVQQIHHGTTRRYRTREAARRAGADATGDFLATPGTLEDGPAQ